MCEVIEAPAFCLGTHPLIRQVRYLGSLDRWVLRQADNPPIVFIDHQRALCALDNIWSAHCVTANPSRCVNLPTASAERHKSDHFPPACIDDTSSLHRLDWPIQFGRTSHTVINLSLYRQVPRFDNGRARVALWRAKDMNGSEPQLPLKEGPTAASFQIVPDFQVSVSETVMDDVIEAHCSRENSPGGAVSICFPLLLNLGNGPYSSSTKAPKIVTDAKATMAVPSSKVIHPHFPLLEGFSRPHAPARPQQKPIKTGSRPSYMV